MSVLPAPRIARVLAFAFTLLILASGWARTDPLTFDRTDLVTGRNTFHVATADLDVDGDLDLVFTVPYEGFISVRLGAGDGSFGPTTEFAAIPGTLRLAIADLNGDGIPDVVTANRGVGGRSSSAPGTPRPSHCGNDEASVPGAVANRAASWHY